MLSTSGRCIARVVTILIASSRSSCGSPESKPQSAPEFLCLKQIYGPYEGTQAIACYSDWRTALVAIEKLGAGTATRLRSGKQIAAGCPGREKIEGIVTSSEPIIKEDRANYGYTWRKVWLDRGRPI